MIARQLPIGLALLASIAVGPASAEDARVVIRQAQKAMGSVTSIRYAGTGRMGVVGMNWNPTAPWHATVITHYVRTIDYPTSSSSEDMTRTQENPPMLGGEAPFVGEVNVGRKVRGQSAWDQPGNSEPMPPPDVPLPMVSLAPERQLQIWLTPHGFLRAAAEHQATARSAVEGGHAVTTVTFVLGNTRMVGTIDGRHMVTRIQTWMANPVLGDMPVETTFSAYRPFKGMTFPTRIVQTQGGLMTMELTVSAAEANVANAALQVPDAVQRATRPQSRVTVERAADGVWLLRGSHNSVLVEFDTFVAVVEAPNDEARSLAVIAEVKKLVPGKPIKYVLNTHHHFDHSGGLRTYVAEGATVITHEANRGFYESAWKQPRTLEPDSLSARPRDPTFVTFKNDYVLTEGGRTIELHLTVGDQHDEFLSFAYLPKEKLLIEADDFSAWYTTSLSLALWNNLLGNIHRLNLDVATIAPLHGGLTTMAEWLGALRRGTAR